MTSRCQQHQGLKSTYCAVKFAILDHTRNCQYCTIEAWDSWLRKKTEISKSIVKLSSHSPMLYLEAFLGST